MPVTHVLRDGKKYFIDAKDLIVSDVVCLDSRVSSVIPADILLVETSDDFLIASYLDTFDSGNKHFYQMRKDGYRVPESAVRKEGMISTEAAEGDEEEGLKWKEMPQCFILDSPFFVPMGVRFFQGQGKGIVVRIGNNTVKALLR